ncbi:hypothetical protein [Halomarina oriensis]|uniref:Uncharacterized protein n=1 Tax=Halomarina oriensis TaxID=671145 RepID=A0A6B0GLP6_9EURY|nr:hypothetical protein [Halomarina oriensis]MWG33693.1 hypothetical protein [Halomarina oriensis]
MSADSAVVWHCAKLVTAGVAVVAVAEFVGGLLAAVPVLGPVLFALALLAGLLVGSYLVLEALWELVEAATAEAADRSSN